MEGQIDLVQLVTGTSPAVGMGLLCLYWLRSVYADALRREREYNEALKDLYAKLLDLQDETTREMAGLRNDLNAVRGDTLPALQREIHALKNTIQTFVLQRADSRQGGAHGGSQERVSQ